MKGDQGTKEDLIKDFMDKNPDDPLVQELGKKLLGRLGKETQAALMDLEKERDDAIQAAQCKIIAKDPTEMSDLLKNFNDQLADEEGKIEDVMNDRMKQIRDQRKKQLDARKAEIMKNKGGNTAYELAQLRDGFEKELADMEAALLREQ